MLIKFTCLLGSVVVAVVAKWPRRHVGREDEERARALLRAADAEGAAEFYGPLEQVAAAASGVDLDDVERALEVCHVTETQARGDVGKATAVRKVRRGGKYPVLWHWINWGKVQFPSAWRGATAADRVCIMNALVREMRARSMRDADIARLKDQIVLGVLTPSSYELEAARMEATWAVEKRQDETRGLTNKKGGRGLQLGSAR
jgi:hypothetical protein